MQDKDLNKITDNELGEVNGGAIDPKLIDLIKTSCVVTYAAPRVSEEMLEELKKRRREDKLSNEPMDSLKCMTDKEEELKDEK